MKPSDTAYTMSALSGIAVITDAIILVDNGSDQFSWGAATARVARTRRQQ